MNAIWLAAMTVLVGAIAPQTRLAASTHMPAEPANLSPALRAFVKSTLNFDDAEANAAVTVVVPLAAGTRTLALWFGDPALNGMHGGPMWILLQSRDRYSLLSEQDGDLGGNMYVVCKAVSHGYHDFRVNEEGSAAEIDSILWRFDGRVYRLYRRTFTVLDKEKFSRRC